MIIIFHYYDGFDSSRLLVEIVGVKFIKEITLAVNLLSDIARDG